VNHLFKAIYSHLPLPLQNLQNNLRIKDRLLLFGKKSREEKTIERIQKKIQHGGKINVAFFSMSVSFWKYDELFSLLQKHPHYNPCVIFTPRPIDPPNIQEMHRQKVSAYCKSKGFRIQDSLQDFIPDIIFYAQPYKNSVSEDLRAYNFLDKLICYAPYAFFISNYKWAYDAQVHNLAWKLFYPSELHRQNAKEIAFNKGTNVEVVGYPLADKFVCNVQSDPWKIKDRNVKRIIWGVHHSILNSDLASCGTFLENAEFMLNLAKSRPDCQFAFKPHPHLKEHLYKHPDWGKNRTDAYYAAWDNFPNTFLIDGTYIDLFKTSDALIHDCGSFTVEYLYVNKPVLYIGNERNHILCNFGKKAMEANYTLNDFSIENFLSNVVLANSTISTKDDFKATIRKQMLEKFLLSPNNKTFAENILDILERSFQ